MKTEVCIKIKVNRKHILDGEPRKPSLCAIALAIRDVCPNEGHIAVGPNSLLVGKAAWNTPSQGTAFIRAFDRTIPKPHPNDYGGELDEDYRHELAEWKKQRAKLKPFTLVLKKTIDDCSVLRGDAHE